VTKATKASFQFIGDFELKAEEWTVVLDELRNALMTRSASVEHSRSLTQHPTDGWHSLSRGYGRYSRATHKQCSNWRTLICSMRMQG
jgi:hypothetical protein